MFHDFFYNNIFTYLFSLNEIAFVVQHIINLFAGLAIWEAKKIKKMLTYNEIPAGITEILCRMESVENSLQQLIVKRIVQPQESYITRKEAAEMLHVSLPTLLSWTLAGQLKGYRIGRRVLYKKNEINEAVTSISVNRKGGQNGKN